MQAREEEDNRNFFDIERHVITAAETGIRVIDFQSDRLVELLDPRFELWRCSNSFYKEPVVRNAADHIEVDHAHDVFQGNGRMIHKVVRTEKPQFFTGKGHEEN